jgi:hypothetical protein
MCGICITLYPELYEMNYTEDVVRLKLGEIPEDLSDSTADWVLPGLCIDTGQKIG